VGDVTVALSALVRKVIGSLPLRHSQQALAARCLFGPGVVDLAQDGSLVSNRLWLAASLPF
jgi:hypothetical protein